MIPIDKVNASSDAQLINWGPLRNCPGQSIICGTVLVVMLLVILKGDKNPAYVS